MQQKRIRIAVIDDQSVFAEALASRLSDEPDLEVVGTAGSSVEALELFSHHEIDVVALDVALAGEDGLALSGASCSTDGPTSGSWSLQVGPMTG